VQLQRLADAAERTAAALHPYEGGRERVAGGEFVYLDDHAAVEWNDEPAPAPAADAPGPMLASAMTERLDGAAFDARYGEGWALEEKLDGHRCILRVLDGRATAWSRPRAGKAANVRALPPHILATAADLADGVYDGELVAPSGKAWDVKSDDRQLVLVLFDVLITARGSVMARTYQERRAILLGILSRLPETQRAISTVLSDPPSWWRVQEIWKRGGEGVILKRLGSPYRPGYRSPDWVKVKEVRTAALTIVGYAPGKNGPRSVFRLRDAAGIETTVGPRGEARRRDVEAAPEAFLGKRVVITFQEQTPSGSYRHPIFDHFAGPGE
jgi:ATP-dependent DNA ligase